MPFDKGTFQTGYEFRLENGHKLPVEEFPKVLKAVTDLGHKYGMDTTSILEQRILGIRLSEEDAAKIESTLGYQLCVREIHAKKRFLIGGPSWPYLRMQE